MATPPSLCSGLSAIVLDYDTVNSSISLATSNKTGIFIDTNQNVGINTYTITNKLSLYCAPNDGIYISNTSSAYTSFILDNNGYLNINGSGTYVRINPSLNIVNHNGTSTGLFLSGTLVTSTATQLNYLSGVVAGTASASKALVLNGSSGISGIAALSASGAITFTSGTASSSTTTGTLVVTGGVGISGNLYVGGTINGSISLSTLAASGAVTFTAGTASSSTTTGTLVVTGGVGISGTTYIGGNLFIGGSTSVGYLASSGSVLFTAGTASTTYTTGTLVVTGGVGISGAVYTNSNLIIGGTLTGVTSITTSSGVTCQYVNATSGSSLFAAFTSSGLVTFTANVSSTSTSSGTLVITGGTGISGNLYVGGSINGAISSSTLSSSGAVTFTAGTTSSSTATGTLVVTGGVGISGNLYVGGSINGSISLTTLSASGAVTFTAGTASTTTGTGTLVVTGGVGISGAVNTGGNLSITGSLSGVTTIGASGIVTLSNSTASTTTGTGALIITGGVGIGGAINSGSSLTISGSLSGVTTIGASGIVTLSNSTASTHSSNGSLILSGGLGIAKNLFIGGNATNVAGWGSFTGVQFVSLNTSYTDTVSSNTGNFAIFSSFGTPTLNATNTGVGYDFAATLYISGGPTAGTNVTITKKYALWAGGDVVVSGSTVATTSGIGGLVVYGGINIGKNLFIQGSYTTSAWGTTGTQMALMTCVYTDSSSTTGTVSSAVINSYAPSVIEASNTGVVYTNSSTLYIGGTPIAGTNVTLTNAYSLWIAAGGTLLGSNISSSSTTTGTLVVTGGVGISGAINSGGTLTISGALSGVTTLAASGAVTFTAGTASSSTTTGTLIVTGGVGISGTTYIGGSLYVNGSQVTPFNSANVLTLTAGTASSSTTTGTLVVTGGVGISGDLYVGGSINGSISLTTLAASGAVTFTAGTASSSTTTGTLVVTGGVGISGNLYVGGSINGSISLTTLAASGAVTFTAGTASSSTTTGTLVVTGGVGISGDLYVGGSINGSLSPTTLTVSGTTESTSKTSGALIVNGGIGVAKTLSVGIGISLTTQSTTNSRTNPIEYISLYDNPIYFRGSYTNDKNHFICYAGSSSQTTWNSGKGFANPATANDGPVLCGNNTVIIGNLSSTATETICATFGSTINSTYSGSNTTLMGNTQINGDLYIPGSACTISNTTSSGLTQLFYKIDSTYGNWEVGARCSAASITAAPAGSYYIYNNLTYGSGSEAAFVINPTNNNIGLQNSSTQNYQLDFGATSSNMQISLFNGTYGIGSCNSNLQYFSNGGHAWYTTASAVQQNASTLSGPILTMYITSDGTFNVSKNISIGGTATTAPFWGTNGIQTSVLSTTFTDTSSIAGTISTINAINAFDQPTINSTNTVTYTTAATVYIDDQPAATGNTTITNPWSLYVNRGDTFLGGTLSIGNISNNSRSSWLSTGICFNILGQTFNNSSTAASSTAVSATFTSFGQPTLTATNTSVTTTRAATVYIANAPIAGTNQTITNRNSLWVGAGNVLIGETGNSSSSTTGALVVTGGVGIGGNVFTNGNITNNGTLSGVTTLSASGVVSLTNTTTSTTSATGTLVLSGGLGIAKNLTMGGTATSAAFWGVNGIQTSIRATTFTDTSSTTGTNGTLNAINSFAAPTTASSSTGVIYTNAATVYIAGPPIAGTNTQITNAYGLYVNGSTYLAGTLNVNYNIQDFPSWLTTGAVLNVVGAILRNSSSANNSTVASAVFTSFDQPSLGASNTNITTTRASTVYIAGAPITSTNQTITNKHSLWIASGSVFINDSTTSNGSNTGALIVTGGLGIGGNVNIGGNLSTTGSITANTRLSAGATNPYSLSAWGINGGIFNIWTTTVTDSSTAASTTNSAFTAFCSFNQPTLAATNLAVVTTNVANVYIGGAPIAGTRQTITNAYALYINSGNTYLGGNITTNGTLTINGNLSGVSTLTASTMIANGGSISTSGSTGSLQSSGGLGVNNNITIGSGGASTSYWSTNGIQLSVRGSANFQDTSSTTGTIASVNAINAFGRPNLAATNTGIIYTTAATVYIANSPNPSTNVTITNPYSLYIAAGNNLIATATASTTTTTGALVVTGGVGIGGAINSGSSLSITGALSGVTTLAASGIVSLSNSTASTSRTTGALVVTGGLGVGAQIFANSLNIPYNAANLISAINLHNNYNSVSSNKWEIGTRISGGPIGGSPNDSFYIYNGLASSGGNGVCALVINASNQIGINGTNPGYLLDFGSNTANFMINLNGGLNSIGYSSNTVNFGSGSGGYNWYYNTAAGTLGTSNMTLSSTGNLVVNGTGTYTMKTTNLCLGTSTYTSRFISCLNSAQGTNTTEYITIGQDASANNQAEFGFKYAGSGSTSNAATIGCYGGSHLLIYADAHVEIPTNYLRIGAAIGAGSSPTFSNIPLLVTGAYSATPSNYIPSYANYPFGSNGYYLNNGSTISTVATASTYYFSGLFLADVASNAFISYSDVRIKTNINTIRPDTAIDFINKCTPVLYNLKSNLDSIEFGYIAQDLFKNGFPNLVQLVPDDSLEEYVDEDGFVSPAGQKMTISYTKIIPLLAVTIKDLYNENSTQKNTIDTLVTENNELKTKVNDIEARLAKLEELFNNL
jgi:hypothetical protein